MKNKILYCIIVMLAVFQMKASAQYSSMTFETDPSILNQFTVMETGAGALMPAVYYNTFHNRADALNLLLVNIYGASQ